MRRRTIGLAAALLALMSAAGMAQEPYYAGKQITLLIGWPTGGGTDLFGRLFSEKLGDSIDGKPNVIVQNMPGAASVTALNHYVERSPRDGTVIFVGTGNLLLRMMLGADKTDAKVSDLSPLVAGPMGRITYVSAQTGLGSYRDLAGRTEPLVLGVIEPLSTLQPTLQFDMLDAPVKIVMGYPGKGETRLAFERGEIDIDEQTTPVFERDVRAQVAEGKAVPLFAQGLIEGDKLVRDPGAPDIPTIAEVYTELKGEAPSGPIWNAYKAVVTAYGNGGKILMSHSDTPEAAREALREGLGVLQQDPDFQASIETALEGYELNSGAELEAVVENIAGMSQEDIDWLKTYLDDNFDMRFN